MRSLKINNKKKKRENRDNKKTKEVNNFWQR